MVAGGLGFGAEHDGRLLPKVLRPSCLYAVGPEPLADMLQQALSEPPGQYDGFRAAYRPFDPIAACKLIDERLEQLVGHQV